MYHTGVKLLSSVKAETKSNCSIAFKLHIQGIQTGVSQVSTTVQGQGSSWTPGRNWAHRWQLSVPWMERRYLKTLGIISHLKGACCFSKFLEHTCLCPHPPSISLYLQHLLFFSLIMYLLHTNLFLSLYFQCYCISSMCQHSFYVTHILHIYWKLSQGTWQTILVRLMTQIQFVFAFSLSSYLPTNKRTEQRAHKIKNTQGHSCMSLPVLHRTIAQISWFQEPAHSEKHSSSLETEPSVGILLFVLFTWKWWPRHHSHPTYNHISFCASYSYQTHCLLLQ